MLSTHFNRRLVYNFNSLRLNNGISIRNYTKHRSEQTASKFLGPFWVFTTPGAKQSFLFVNTFFLLLMYPLDPYIFNVRKLKADMDAKVRS